MNIFPEKDLPESIVIWVMRPFSTPDPLGAVEPFVAQDGQAVFLHVILEDLLGHAGLEDPHRAFILVHRHRALALVAEGLGTLPCPSGVLLVFDPDAVVEIAARPPMTALLPVSV
jgi:hypothetical protein